MDDMKISFKVEITGCISDGDANCPHMRMLRFSPYCSKVNTNRMTVCGQNMYQLTKTCPMVRAQYQDDSPELKSRWRIISNIEEREVEA